MKVIWQGAITFGLVNIPIKLYAATQEHVLGFTLLHSYCHTPVKYHRWCPHCKKEITWQQTVKGLEIKDGTYVVLTKEMLEKLRPQKTETIQIVEFVKTDQVDPLYLNHHYYVAPGKKNNMAYTLFMKALSKVDKVAIGRFVMRDKEYTCALRPSGDHLLLTTLHYSYEIKKIEELENSTNIKITPQELKLAEELIQKLTVKKFDMSKFKDTFAQEIKKLLQSKKGKKTRISKKKKERAEKAPSLMQSLRASLDHAPVVAGIRAKGRR
jgi:DNA end-binding protein Ku